jgi:hypothetical protein
VLKASKASSPNDCATANRPAKDRHVLASLKGGRASAQFQHSRPAAVAGRVVDQRSSSTVTEVNNDGLLKEQWKKGLFDSTTSNQRRGRDSNPRSSF